MVFELFDSDDSERCRIIYYKLPGNPFFIKVNDNGTYSVMCKGRMAGAQDFTFEGDSVLSSELSRIDYAKRVLRKFYRKMKNEV